jgi:anti-sigma factor (TIGR02949 family)
MNGCADEHEHGNCHELISSLSEYVDGSLQAEICQEIERHLRECHKCRVVVNTLKKTVELYQETADDAAMPEAVRERLFKRLELKDYILKDK